MDEEDCCGRAILIVNQKGKGFDDLPKSVGKVGRELRSLLELLKFEVEFKANASADFIRSYISEVVKDMRFNPEKHTIIFYFIGHGLKGEILTPESKLKIDKDILLPFNENADHLLAVPKLFFFDCCQGISWDEGKVVAMGPREDVLLEEYIRRVPTIANMIVAYSTLPMLKALCIEQDGPLWTKHVMIEMKKDQPIYMMLHRAQAGVIEEFRRSKLEEKDFYGAHPKLQAPNFTSTLYGARVSNLWRDAGHAADSGEGGEGNEARIEPDSGGRLSDQSSAAKPRIEGSKSKYAIPKIELLEDLPGVDGNTFNVLAKIGADYSKFAIHLLQDDDSYNFVRTQEKELGRNSEEINRAIAIKWLQNGRDKSWKFLISVLRIIGKGTAADDLTQALKKHGVFVHVA